MLLKSTLGLIQIKEQRQNYRIHFGSRTFQEFSCLETLHAAQPAWVLFLLAPNSLVSSTHVLDFTYKHMARSRLREIV